MLKNLPRCACLATAVITTAAMAQALANPATTARLSTLPAVDAASPCVQTLAHRYSSKEAISLLQRAKQPTEQPSDETHEVFRLAAELGDRVCLEWWLARMPELIPAGDGRYSALHAAAVAGRTDIVQLLLDKGEHVDVKDEFGWTAAELAALADPRGRGAIAAGRRGSPLGLSRARGHCRRGDSLASGADQRAAVSRIYLQRPGLRARTRH